MNEERINSRRTFSNSPNSIVRVFINWRNSTLVIIIDWLLISVLLLSSILSFLLFITVSSRLMAPNIYIYIYFYSHLLQSTILNRVCVCVRVIFFSFFLRHTATDKESHRQHFGSGARRPLGRQHKRQPEESKCQRARTSLEVWSLRAVPTGSVGTPTASQTGMWSGGKCVCVWGGGGGHCLGCHTTRRDILHLIHSFFLLLLLFLWLLFCLSRVIVSVFRDGFINNEWLYTMLSRSRNYTERGKMWSRIEPLQILWLHVKRPFCLLYTTRVRLKFIRL